MKIGNLEIRGDLVLAPMAGVTDLAFRTICAELGATVTVTEMVSSRALIYQDKKSRSLLHRTPIGVCGAQIFGNDPSVMAEGAALALEASGADFIDINMGCPMPKIANNGDGSALMKDPEKAARIVEAVVKAVPVPVTVKMRKGWDKSSCNAPELAAHVRRFHELFFTLSPDKNAIEGNIRRAMFLSDRSAYAHYVDPAEQGYYNRIISGNVNQRVGIDSVKCDFHTYPYEVVTYAKLSIIREKSVTERSLVTRGRLLNSTRSDNNPHGFILEAFRVVENRDIRVYDR